jgi:hypothetical protein
VPALEWLWQQYGKPTYDKFTGGDEGVNSADYDNNPMMPNKYSRLPGVNVVRPGTDRFTKRDAYRLDGVAGLFLKSFFYPEGAHYRKPNKYSDKSALFGGTGEILLTTDLAG